MRFTVLTIFPEIFDGFTRTSLIEKALAKKFIEIDIVNIRDFSSAPHHKVDDEPYGGGAGMVLSPEPLAKAIEYAKKKNPNSKVILMTPSGKSFKQEIAENLAEKSQSLIIICGRYEGIDQRIIDIYVDEEYSIGDYVLMGGEIPAMAVIEAISRLKNNVLGNSESVVNESFSGTNKILEAPQYTRPRSFNNKEVPEILCSGNHKAIEKWREEKALEKTKLNRPELINE